MTAPTPAAHAWADERGRLLGIAYRMLGDFGLAEDVVSEVAIEALRQERDGAAPVRSWPALLTTICVRRSIDLVRGLAASREEYTGHWLPEPVATSRLPEEAVADREMLSIALLHVAEQLAPETRAAVVLHRAFGMTAGEIGEILERSPAAVRQLISRGERRLRIDPEADAPRSLARDDLARLVEAIGSGDVAGVTALLAPDAILWADGGGQVRSALNPVFGADRIARFFVGILQKAAREASREAAWEASWEAAPSSIGAVLIDVNGEPSIALRLSGRTDILGIEADANGRITGLRQIGAPAKLRFAFPA
ncbi:RNA polymerase sigma-70 factor (ECF subfamily) [Microbacterium resistens]|uniref:RNA polymerase sigma-70 factor (ECF subfamily) n=1 Tax=Microbacterium resistens TaxID=156977 RepID=A0ABU1SAJ9_9MICO|nr:sigma factor-like helix-turn-helix DNA-binding protein [Microbacterium resistens]MDR6866639.1 RNA polymerase sigma-70 factor (ECF subfamily) [Microbacterium resistens]